MGRVNKGTQVADTSGGGGIGDVAQPERSGPEGLQSRKGEDTGEDGTGCVVSLGTFAEVEAGLVAVCLLARAQEVAEPGHTQPKYTNLQ